MPPKKSKKTNKHNQDWADDDDGSVDIVAASAVNDDATVNEPSQLNRGNKISKKNKNKNKNQDWDDESEVDDDDYDANVAEQMSAYLSEMVEETSSTEEVADEELTTIPKGKISKKNKRKKKNFDLEEDDDSNLVDDVDYDANVAEQMSAYLSEMVEETSSTEEVADEELTTIPKGKISKKNKRKKKNFDLEEDDDSNLVDDVDYDANVAEQMSAYLSEMVEETSSTEEVADEELATIPKGKISKKNKQKKKNFDLEEDDDSTLG